MSDEREWVKTVKAALKAEFRGGDLFVETDQRLPYAIPIASYSDRDGAPNLTDPKSERPHGYQTDLLIAEKLAGTTRWVPRVVVEFKLGRVGTHDVLTYSAKAATHKSVHPYLRYGIVIGKYEGPIPGRMIRHGHQFDFMVTLASEKLSKLDRERLVDLLKDEIAASRIIADMNANNANVHVLHRKLVTSG